METWCLSVCVSVVVADPSVHQIDSEFDRLTRDNLATVKSFGSNLMDVICRDACDGHNVGRVSLSVCMVITSDGLVSVCVWS